MKKTLSALLVGILSVAIVGCGKKAPQQQEQKQSSSEQQKANGGLGVTTGDFDAKFTHFYVHQFKIPSMPDARVQTVMIDGTVKNNKFMRCMNESLCVMGETEYDGQTIKEITALAPGNKPNKMQFITSVVGGATPDAPFIDDIKPMIDKGVKEAFLSKTHEVDKERNGHKLKFYADRDSTGELIRVTVTK